MADVLDESGELVVEGLDLSDEVLRFFDGCFGVERAIRCVGLIFAFEGFEGGADVLLLLLEFLERFTETFQLERDLPLRDLGRGKYLLVFGELLLVGGELLRDFFESFEVFLNGFAPMLGKVLERPVRGLVRV